MTCLGPHQPLSPLPAQCHRYCLQSLGRQSAAGSVNGFRSANAMTATTADIPLGKILIAIANPVQREPLAGALTAAGYAVNGLPAGIPILDAVQADQPDVLLITTTLPSGSGLELCAQLQADPAASTLVMFVGPADRRDRLQAFAVGAVDFIPEPCWPEEVVARIQTHLTRDRVYRRVQAQAQRALSAASPSPLLATLQRTLHQQTQKLQEKNQLLETEIQERQEVEQALRREQHKSEQLLLNILPQAIVTQLKQFQGSLAERFDHATVMFADIVDFTTLATALKPLELVSMLNQIFSAFDRLAEKYGLEKSKPSGMPTWWLVGYPSPVKATSTQSLRWP